MVILCQKCGAGGYSELLVYCVDCQSSAEHSYCLDKIQIIEENGKYTKWTCWDCSQRTPKVASLTKHSSDGVKEKMRCQHLRANSAADVAHKKRCKDSNGCSLDKAELLLVRQMNSESIKKARACSLLREEKGRGGYTALKKMRKEHRVCSYEKEEVLLPTQLDCESIKKTRDCSSPRIEKEDSGGAATLKKTRDCSSSGIEKEDSGGAATLKKRCKDNNGCSVDKVEEPLLARELLSESIDKTRDGSVLKVEKKNLISWDNEDGEKRKNKQPRRRLILAHGDSSDEESTHVKIGRDHRDEEATNRGVILAEKPVDSLLSKDDAGQIQELPPVFVRASESTVQASDVCSSLVEISCHQLGTDDHDYVHARPIIDPIWRGCFVVCNSMYGMILAHLSNKACSRAVKWVNMLPQVLFLDKLPRKNTWPKKFKNSPPTDECIGFYFFPEGVSDEAAYYQLMCEINDGDLALKVTIDEAELLIFSSQVLPLQDSTFCGKWYLWGLFRLRQVGTPSTNRSTINNTPEKVLSPSAGHADNQEERKRARRRSNSPSRNDNDNRFDTVSPLHTQASVPKSVGTPLSTFLELHCPNNPEKSTDYRHSLEKQFDCKEDRGIGSEARDMKFSSLEALSTVVCYDEAVKDDSELELFPLAMEDMAVAARVGWSGGFNLDLGIGLPMSNDVPSRSKPKNDYLRLDEEIF